MELTGTIKLIGHTQDISSSFRKRELVVTTNEQYPQHIMIEFTQDKADLLNSYKVGDNVTVGINLRGREWQSPQGEMRYFNTIQGWRIQQAFNGQNQSAVDNYHNQQQQGFNQGQQQGFNQGQQQGFNQNASFSSQQQQGFNQQQGQSQYDAFSQDDHDDLPF